MEAEHSSETPVPIYHVTWHHIHRRRLYS